MRAAAGRAGAARPGRSRRRRAGAAGRRGRRAGSARWRPGATVRGRAASSCAGQPDWRHRVARPLCSSSAPDSSTAGESFRVDPRFEGASAWRRSVKRAPTRSISASAPSSATVSSPISIGLGAPSAALIACFTPQSASALRRRNRQAGQRTGAADPATGISTVRPRSSRRAEPRCIAPFAIVIAQWSSETARTLVACVLRAVTRSPRGDGDGSCMIRPSISGVAGRSESGRAAGCAPTAPPPR